MPRRLALFHTMDPRGDKLGGIETHVRLMLARHPADVELLFVGIDERGDCPLGHVTPIACDGRTIAFLPVARIPSDRINLAATRVFQSTTLRYALGLVRHLPALRRALRGQAASGEIERYEFAAIPKLLRLPFVLLVHNEGTKDDKMDSLLKRYWFLHQWNERWALALADSVFAVNEAIARHVERIAPSHARKTAVMSVSVDTERFVPTPFPASDDAFHVCFAGRLDDFKDPPLMFATLAKLAARLEATPVGRFRRVVFDYVGASDPQRFAEFAGIERFTVRHGPRKAAEVAALMARAHAGIITSFFEGMPCYLLEMLASGRPVGAIALPQFSRLILPGYSGALVERQPEPEASAEKLAEAFVGIARAIDEGRLDPAAMAALVAPYSVESQMGRLFACHAALATQR
jgi:glycosyltransferase involved in cell wall biosynthesis